MVEPMKETLDPLLEVYFVTNLKYIQSKCIIHAEWIILPAYMFNLK